MRVGLGIGLVVVADEVKIAMHREMREMMQEVAVFIGAFPRQRFVGDDDVAENAGVAFGHGFRRGKRQHVGRLVDAAPFAVQHAHRRIIGQQDTHFAARC